MKMDLFFTADELRENILADKAVIVIDVLRASVTIAQALYNGCKDIIPVESAERALDLMQKIGRQFVLLCGERDGQKIEGFDLGNSPFEYTEPVVRDKTLIFATTNGSKAIVKAASGEKVVIGSFVNFKEVAELVLNLNKDLAIVCSGKEGKFSLEDAVCGGMFVHKLQEQKKADLNDAAQAAAVLYLKHKDNLLKVLETCEHGKFLTSLGFEKDLAFCSQLNSLPVLPILENGRIVKYTSLS